MENLFKERKGFGLDTFISVSVDGLVRGQPDFQQGPVFYGLCGNVVRSKPLQTVREKREKETGKSKNRLDYLLSLE